VDDHERARIQLLDIDCRRMNRMPGRKHPVLALRFVLAGRFIVDGFWLPVGSFLGRLMGLRGMPVGGHFGACVSLAE
jgi:hypothetical protein